MIPLQHGLILAAVLFVLGLTSLVLRRNLLFMLIGLEIMINAAALALVVAGSYWGQADGQVMYILAISLAAAEARCADESSLFNNPVSADRLLAVGVFPWSLVGEPVGCDRHGLGGPGGAGNALCRHRLLC